MKGMILINALRGTARSAFEEQKRSVDRIDDVLKYRTVLINNRNYQGCEGIVQNYYFDCGKEYLRVSIKGVIDLVEFADCELM